MYFQWQLEGLLIIWYATLQSVSISKFPIFILLHNKIPLKIAVSSAPTISPCRRGMLKPYKKFPDWVRRIPPAVAWPALLEPSVFVLTNPIEGLDKTSHLPLLFGICRTRTRIVLRILDSQVDGMQIHKQKLDCLYQQQHWEASIIPLFSIAASTGNTFDSNLHMNALTFEK